MVFCCKQSKRTLFIGKTLTDSSSTENMKDSERPLTLIGISVHFLLTSSIVLFKIEIG